jgi:hypothetical protein
MLGDTPKSFILPGRNRLNNDVPARLQMNINASQNSGRRMVQNDTQNVATAWQSGYFLAPWPKPISARKYIFQNMQQSRIRRNISPVRSHAHLPNSINVQKHLTQSRMLFCTRNNTLTYLAL